MLKKIIAFLLSAVLVLTMSVVSFAAEHSYVEATDKITVSGTLTSGEADKDVMVMLFSKSGEEYNIEYFGKTKTTANGAYTWAFGVDKAYDRESIVELSLRVNADGIDVTTDSVKDITYDPNWVKVSLPGDTLDTGLVVAASKLLKKNQRVYIKGNIKAENAGKMVTLAVVKKNNKEEVIYFNGAKAEENGDYSFKFKLAQDADMEDYYVRINLGGVDVSNTLLEAIEEIEAMYTAETSLTKDGSRAAVSTKVIDNYGTMTGGTQIVAFYNEAGKMIDATMQKLSDVTPTVEGEKLVYTLECDVPEDTDRAKCMLWESFKTMLPMGEIVTPEN